MHAFRPRPLSVLTGAAALIVLSACSGANFGGAANSGSDRSLKTGGGSPGGGSAGGGSPGADAVNGNTGDNGTQNTGNGGGSAGGGGSPANGSGGGSAGSPGGGTPGTGSSAASGQDAGASTDSGNATGTGGAAITNDGTVCFTTVANSTPQVSTTNAPFLQTPTGSVDSVGFTQWTPKSDDNPLPPQKVADNLQAGDRISVSNITGTINDRDGSGPCSTGINAASTAVMKHVLILQLTDGNDKVVDPGIPTTVTFNGGPITLGAIRLNDLTTTKLTIPAGVVRAYVSVGDTRYSDNHSTCHFTFTVEQQAPCAPGQQGSTP